MNEPHPDYYDHPIFHPTTLRLKTPMMIELEKTMLRWVWTGSTGGLIFGPSRIGKSKAMKWLTNVLRTRGGTVIPTYYISLGDRDIRTITAIFRALCYSADLRVSNSDRADHLIDRFIHYVLDQSVEAKCDQAVLIVDEMQLLQLDQFEAFAELYNRLELFDILLSVFFVGNDPECWQLINDIERLEKARISGRFFTQGYEFNGITSCAQLTECLKQYDVLRFPIEGPTYTEYFLSNDVKNGWRLQSLDHILWEGFRRYQKKYGFKSWGMKYFTGTILTLLSDYLPVYGINAIDEGLIDECIKISGLIPSLTRPAA